MTRDELFEKAMQVPDDKRLAYGRKLLKEYKGDDRAFIGPWLEEFIISNSKIN